MRLCCYTPTDHLDWVTSAFWSHQHCPAWDDRLSAIDASPLLVLTCRLMHCHQGLLAQEIHTGMHWPYRNTDDFQRAPASYQKADLVSYSSCGSPLKDEQPQHKETRLFVNEYARGCGRMQMDRLGKQAESHAVVFIVVDRRRPQTLAPTRSQRHQTGFLMMLLVT